MATIEADAAVRAAKRWVARTRNEVGTEPFDDVRDVWTVALVDALAASEAARRQAEEESAARGACLRALWARLPQPTLDDLCDWQRDQIDAVLARPVARALADAPSRPEPPADGLHEMIRRAEVDVEEHRETAEGEWCGGYLKGLRDALAAAPVAEGRDDRLALLRRWIEANMKQSLVQARADYCTDEDCIRQNAYGRMCRITLQRFDMEADALVRDVAEHERTSGAALATPPVAEGDGLRETRERELIECIVGFTGLADLPMGEYKARFGIPDGQMSFANAWDRAMERARAALSAVEAAS